MDEWKYVMDELEALAEDFKTVNFDQTPRELIWRIKYLAALGLLTAKLTELQMAANTARRAGAPITPDGTTPAGKTKRRTRSGGAARARVVKTE